MEARKAAAAAASVQRKIIVAQREADSQGKGVFSKMFRSAGAHESRCDSRSESVGITGAAAGESPGAIREGAGVVREVDGTDMLLRMMNDACKDDREGIRRSEQGSRTHGQERQSGMTVRMRMLEHM